MTHSRVIPPSSITLLRSRCRPGSSRPPNAEYESFIGMKPLYTMSMLAGTLPTRGRHGTSNFDGRVQSGQRAYRVSSARQAAHAVSAIHEIPTHALQVRVQLRAKGTLNAVVRPLVVLVVLQAGCEGVTARRRTTVSRPTADGARQPHPHQPRTAKSCSDTESKQWLEEFSTDSGTSTPLTQMPPWGRYPAQRHTCTHPRSATPKT